MSATAARLGCKVRPAVPSVADGKCASSTSGRSQSDYAFIGEDPDAPDNRLRVRILIWSLPTPVCIPLDAYGNAVLEGLPKPDRLVALEYLAMHLALVVIPEPGSRPYHQATPLDETLYATLSTLRSRKVLGLCVVNWVHRRLKPPRGGKKHSWECSALPSSGGRRIWEIYGNPVACGEVSRSLGSIDSTVDSTTDSTMIQLKLRKSTVQRVIPWGVHWEPMGSSRVRQGFREK